MSEYRDQLVILQGRIEALEARLAVARRVKTAPVIAMFLAGLGIAQTGAVLGAGEQSVDAAPGDDAIRKGTDGVTRVDAPFQVMGAGGKVLLEVSPEDGGVAGVAIHSEGGGGAVTVASSDHKPLVIIGRQASGHGMTVAFDTAGRPRSFVFGNGAIKVDNEAGDQVAGVLSRPDGKGSVAVWAHGLKRVAELTEGAARSGELSIFDTNKARVALVTADPSGNGGLELFGAGKNTAAVDLGINNIGGGQLALANPAGQQTAYLTGNDSTGNGAVMLAKDGKEIASLSLNAVGAGHLLLRNSAGGYGLDAAGASEKAGRGGSLSIFNPDATVVAGIGTDEKGGGLVVVQEGPEFFVQLSRSSDSQGGEINLRNSKGETGVTAMADTGAGGSVVVLNHDGYPVAAVGSQAGGKGSVLVYDKDHAAAEMSSSNGVGSLALRNAQDEMGFSASADLGSGGALVVLNREGYPVATVESGKGGQGSVTIVDKDHAVAEMSSANGAGSLTLFDAQQKTAIDVDGANGRLITLHNGQVTASIGSDDGGGRVAAYAKAGAVAELAANQMGGGIVFVRNSAAKAIVAGMSTEHESGTVIVRDSKGTALAEMSTTPDNRGEIKVLNASGKMLAAMSAQPDGNGGQLDVTNGSALVASLAARESGHGALQLNDSSGNPIVEAGMMTDGRGVVLAGPNPKCPSGGMGLVPPGCIMGSAGK
jgi:hypothetical protein